MAEINYEVWKGKNLTQKYLTGVRGAIPMAKEQFDVILRLIKLNNRPIETMLDMGSGDGILASVILSVYPEAKGVLLDISDHMIETAKEKLNDFKENLDFVVYDYSKKDWVQKASSQYPYDLIISGLSIHHQTDERKKELYSEIFDLLKPGGIFINLEHVASSTEWVNSLFNDCFIESLIQMHNRINPEVTREQVADQFFNRSDKEANILVPVEKQCEWLREIGYSDVDCYFKIYEIAIFGGRKLV